MDPRTLAHDAHRRADAAELPRELLSALDNFRPDAYDPRGVTHGIDLLRAEGWLARVRAPEFAIHGHDVLADARRAFGRQLRLLYDVGRGSLPLGRIFEGHVNALELVARSATATQAARWGSDADAGHLFGVWNTEASDGVHIRPHDNGGYELQGAKTFCSGARDVTRALITGQRWEAGRAAGWQMLVVPMERLDASRIDDSFWSPLGMEASASLRVDFSGLRISAADFLGAVDDYHVQPHFSGGAVRFAAVQLGGARALYDHTLALLKSMHREHDPYQCHRIARMELAHQGAYHWLALAPDAALPGGPPDARVVHYANMTRTAILEACNQILDLAEQAVGARGFLHPKPIQRIYRDLKMYLRQPAPDNALAAVGRLAAEHADLSHLGIATESVDPLAACADWPVDAEIAPVETATVKTAAAT